MRFPVILLFWVKLSILPDYVIHLDPSFGNDLGRDLGSWCEKNDSSFEIAPVNLEHLKSSDRYREQRGMYK